MGKSVTLSMPLPKAIQAGRADDDNLNTGLSASPEAQTTTRRSPDGSPTCSTSDGFASKYLGAGRFDLEVWNENASGSEFLYINNYYVPAFALMMKYLADLVQATADVASANP